jgi:CheY-like chemotaxis protein
MDGLTTIKAIRQIRSAIPIIAVSGSVSRGDGPEMSNFGSTMAEVGLVATLYKPFRPAELNEAIRNALAGKAPAPSAART